MVPEPRQLPKRSLAGNLRFLMLRKLTRLMNKADTVRTVELWSVASVADVVMDQYGDGESGKNLEPFEVHFLRSFFRLIERDCKLRERGR